MNLMLNGIEAMRGTGGELTIASKRTEQGQLLISVSDSGIGLPAGEAERIFDAFFTTKSQGTGMGLSISRRIVESHGGRLWASPNAGRGADLSVHAARRGEIRAPRAAYGRDPISPTTRMVGTVWRASNERACRLPSFR